jgi:hypothetical protein
MIFSSILGLLQLAAAAAAAASGLRYNARVEPTAAAGAPVNNCTPIAFGAVPMPVGYKSMPCSETLDATAAIESALQWCATSTVLLPPGEFRVDGTLTANTSVFLLYKWFRQGARGPRRTRQTMLPPGREVRTYVDRPGRAGPLPEYYNL